MNLYVGRKFFRFLNVVVEDKDFIEKVRKYGILMLWDVLCLEYGRRFKNVEGL